MFTFRQKILFSYLAVFLVFLAILFPFASHMVKKIVVNAMQERTEELIHKIQSAPNNDALIRRLKEQKPQIFFRVSVISDDMKVLYDSHTKRLFGPRFSQDYVVSHREILEAAETGKGYNEEYSELLAQKFSYLAKAFDFHGKKYIIRTAFPYKYVTDLTRDFEIGFLAIATAVLVLFSILTWLIINHLTRPIHDIITAVRPYQEGEKSMLPEVILKSASPGDEFHKLAQTLNSLSLRIQKQINSLVEERNEKKTVLESLEEGVVAVNSHMIITFANTMAQKILGMSEDQLIGQSFIVTEENKCYNLLLECQEHHEPKSSTIQMKNKAGRNYYDIVAAPKKDKSGAILVLQDKTSHYKILRMRTDFVANASHELKTPITIIQGFAETLHDNPELPIATTMEITQKIMTSCVRMTTLIKDLLTLTDIEHIPLSRLDICDLYALTERCSEMVKQVYPDTEITITRLDADEMTIVADINLMEMALLNLIENAAKYSVPPAKIAIQMGHSGDSYIKYGVKDSGIGIPKANIDHIFERFYTVNKQESRKKGGSGLGLAIVDTIIEKHFGTISVESEEGVGTTFTLLLPVDLKNLPVSASHYL